MIYSWNFFGKCPIPFMKFIVKINSAGAQSRFYLYDIISLWNWGFGTARMIFMKTNSYLLEKSLKIDEWAIRDGNSLVKFIVQIVSACAQSKSLPYQIISLQNHIGQFLKSFPDMPNPVLLGYIMELGLGTSQKIFLKSFLMVPNTVL